MILFLLGGAGGYDDGRIHAPCPLIRSHIHAPGIKAHVQALIRLVVLLLGGLLCRGWGYD